MFFPVKSKKDIVTLAKEIDRWPAEKKAKFASFFGGGHERWYYQEIGGKPYVISVAEVARPEGYADLATSDDEFTKWFRKRTKKITGISLKKAPKGLFGIEIEQCARCGGRLKVIASIEQPELIERILAHRGERGEEASATASLGARAPPLGSLF